MDEASRDLLLRLARAEARAAPGAARHAHAIWRSPGRRLTRTMIRALAALPAARCRAAADRDRRAAPPRRTRCAPHDVEEIARRSGGNTLFLFELLEAVRRPGPIEALPDSVESLIAGDIDRLSPDGPDGAPLRRRARRELRSGGSLAAAVRGEVALDDGVWERLGDFVDAEHARAACGSATRSSAMPPTRGCPTGAAASCTTVSARRSRRIAGARSTRRSAMLAFHFLEAQRYDKAWHYCRRRRRPGDGGLRERRCGALLRARSRGGAPDARRPDRRSRRGVAGAETARRSEQARSTAHSRRSGTRRGCSRTIPWSRRGCTRSDRSYGLGQEPSRTRCARPRPACASSRGSGQRLPPASARACTSVSADLRMLQGHAREALDLARSAAEEAEATGELEALARSFSVLDSAYQMLGQPQKAVHEREGTRDLGALGLARRARSSR